LERARTSIKRALFWGHENDRVRCRLCPKLCLIAEGRLGFCGVRENVGGELYSLIYARASSVAVDPIEKKPLFHFYPGSLVYSLGTIGCNLRCKHCQNYVIAHARAHELASRLLHVPPAETAEAAEREGCAGVALTYNEPTIWIEYALDLFAECRARNLYTVFVTNGYITEEALDAVAPVLDAYRVDIKGFSSRSYHEIAGIRDFSPIVAAAERAFKHHRAHVEIVTLVIPTVNDSEGELRDIARWIRDSLSPSVPWHVTRFYPYLRFSHLPPTPIVTLERAREIGLEEGLRFVYIGNVPGHAAENTVCPSCGKTVVERSGYMIEKKHVRDGCCAFCGEDLNMRGV
jgi:pyruvate formate lyase activating enzyme